MKIKESAATLSTLANGCELVTGIIKGVVGNELADSMNGGDLTTELINNLSITVFKKTLEKKVGAL